MSDTSKPRRPDGARAPLPESARAKGRGPAPSHHDERCLKRYYTPRPPDPRRTVPVRYS